MSIARATPIALALLLAACGGDETRSEEDRAADVAKSYVSNHSNNDEAECRETLARGVDPRLCDDLGPLASRVNPEVKDTRVTGDTALVVVTGAGNNVLLGVNLVKELGEWRVKTWRGREK